MTAPEPTTTSVPAALGALARREPARPLATFYDDATGERVELSVATYANWVAKTAGLAQDELELERGGLVLLDLPTHWLGAVWLGAAWSLGLAVSDDSLLLEDADLVVTGPTGVADWSHRAHVPVVALSLKPLGGRFDEPLPNGVLDFGAVVLGQPDSFTAWVPPHADDAAWRSAGAAPDASPTQAQLLAEASRSGVVSPGGRLLTDRNPCTRQGLSTLLSTLVLDASTVWVAHPDAGGWAARAEQERVTDQDRSLPD